MKKLTIPTILAAIAIVLVSAGYHKYPTMLFLNSQGEIIPTKVGVQVDLEKE